MWEASPKSWWRTGRGSTADAAKRYSVRQTDRRLRELRRRHGRLAAFVPADDQRDAHAELRIGSAFHRAQREHRGSGHIRLPAYEQAAGRAVDARLPWAP
jgi:hypothetical protein